MTPRGGARTLSALLGGNRDVALLEAFAFRDPQPISASDACALSKMSWATAHRRIDAWTSASMLEVVGFKGKAPLYRLNSASPAVAAVVRGLRLVLAEMLDSDLLQEGLTEPDLGGQLILRFRGNSEELASSPPFLKVDLDLGRGPIPSAC